MSNFQKLSLGVSRQAPIQGTDIASGSATNGQVLTADGSGNSAFVMPSSTSAIAPTIQIFLSGSGTYTTPAGVLYIEVEMVGGGGGGGGSGTDTSGGQGGLGGTTTFGTSLLVANGGTGGSGLNGAPGGTGGTASLGAGSIGTALSGGSGSGSQQTNSEAVYAIGGAGAATPFGGNGGGGSTGSDGLSAIIDTGSGGGGGGGTLSGSTINSGSGGGAGGYIKAIVTSPLSAYSYTVGSGGGGGTAGTSGCTGGTGGSGIIIVTEHYSSGGSFSNPMTTAGDLIYGSTTGSPSVPDRLGIGSNGQVLTVIDGLPAWGAGSSPATFGSRSSPLAIVAADGLVGGTNVSTAALVQVSFIQGSSGPVTITASPAIAAGTIVGQELQIIVPSPTTAANTVTIPNQSAAVELNGDWTGGPGDMLTLIWDSTAWVEKCRNN